MSSIRKIACYLTLMLLLNCVIQGEMIWLSELLEGRMFPEQNMRGDFEIYRDTLELVWSELVWFPVPVSAGNADAEVAFENSWMAERSYGGKRGHEGTDIMASVDEPGYYPVVSITDGIIEQVGWLEKGGWRIGVRSGNGNYYYYAHLASYAKEWNAGEPVEAGELLGYMGDTGYGPEGTTGQFPVHLHLGIYVPLGADQEMAVNPYWMLKYLENKKLSYSY
ncbi:MAG: M23 family metallopeptidase [Lachnospiraceae bacterium]|nr:M23 family metallopeptidase [Lachnospiraceae bacterium]